MTKKIRIENADTSEFKVVVQVWDKGLNGAPDTMNAEINLDHPCFMSELFIHDTRYLVVKEAP